MQVSVESPSKIERRVTVVVPFEKIDAAFDKRIVKLSQTANVKGFRPGKVPTDVIKQRFGDTARQEALSEVIQSSLYAAIDQEKLNPVDTPTVEPKNINPGQPLEFVATFQVLPEINEVHFDAQTMEKEISTITEEDITKVVNHLANQHITWKKVDRAAAEKDQTVIDFEGSMDGKIFEGGVAHDYPIVIGSKMMIPGFEEGLIGVKPGEEKVIPVTFPENYFAKEYAGKAAEFKIKMIKISEPIHPEFNQAFIKKLGVKSGLLEDLHAEIRKNLQREVVRLTEAKLKAKVFNKLLEQNTVEVPLALIDKEANRLHQELHPHHGNNPHNHSEAEMKGFKDAARQNVILGLLVGSLVKKHDLKPDKAKVDEHIANLAASYENPAEVIKWYSTNKRQLAEAEMRILEEQVVQKLLENVKVTEKMLSYSDFIKAAN